MYTWQVLAFPKSAVGFSGSAGGVEHTISTVSKNDVINVQTGLTKDNMVTIDRRKRLQTKRHGTSPGEHAYIPAESVFSLLWC